MNYDKCPNCNKSLKGFLSANLLPQSKVDLINKHFKENKEAYCTSCSEPLLNNIAYNLEQQKSQTAQNIKQQKSQIENRLKQIIHHIPIISSPAPIKWDYEIIGMVTAQTTSGTGFATELSRSFNDFFGSGSNATNLKIATATDLCKADLRVQCVQQGGNAIISTDIDFNEIGAGTTNMLMVCMAGTAICVTDMTNFNIKNRDKIVEIMELAEQL